MRSIKLRPVLYLTATLAALTAADGVLTAEHLLSDTASGWVTAAIAVLGAVLGVATHGAVTPLARPRDADGVRLVPVTTKPDVGADTKVV